MKYLSRILILLTVMFLGCKEKSAEQTASTSIKESNTAIAPKVTSTVKVKNSTDTNKQQEEGKPKKPTYTIMPEGITVSWEGYKFTSKQGVKGRFKTIEIKKAPQKVATPLDAFRDVEFSIPTSSVFSNDEGRDHKLKTLFFGMMDKTEMITGSLKVENKQIRLYLTMNNVTRKVILAQKISGRYAKLKGVIDILDFGATKAYNSIHTACEQLHKGEDGVSKTWSQVLIEASIHLK